MTAVLPGGRERQLGVLVGALLLVSVAALVGQIYGWFDMGFVLAFLALPAAIIAIGIARWAVRADYQVFTRRLVLGLIAGALATAGYDLVRLLLQETLPLHFNAFAIHARFGELIIDRPRTTTAAKVAGWAYHFSNGFTFALCFTLVTGRVRWYWGLLYGLVLEGLMVLMYPTGFGVSRGNEAFLLVSFVGHGTYGAILGLVNQRYNVPEPRVARTQR